MGALVLAIYMLNVHLIPHHINKKI